MTDRALDAEVAENIDGVYASGLDQEPAFQRYQHAHGNHAACILTVTNDERARVEVQG